MTGIPGKHRTARLDDDIHQLVSAKVVVGIDESSGSDTALRWAVHYAGIHGRGLHIAHGMNTAGVTTVGAYAVSSPWVLDEARANGESVVARAAQLARLLAPDLPITTELVADSASTVLIDRSDAAFAVVLGATGSTGTLGHLGSTLLAVVAHAHGAVIVVRTDPDAGDIVHYSGPVVVGVDGGPLSDAAVAAAFAEAAQRGTDLVAVHVWNDQNFGHYAGYDTVRLPDGNPGEAENAVLAERVAGWQEKFPDVPVMRASYAFAPTVHLQTWSQSAQLVVVGSRGRGGFAGLLFGSTANSLVQHARCPVMVVHP
ncbi:universal stress protein [Nocardia jiangxiensis]|uniref:Universal stress protein n=1 Tax=Nocardia jiangxiensis TaxID=282685 RepID=A0ABW6RWL9_9NOCA|nr:universal stress protein [Nocardia jiangxiensis]